MRAIRVVNVGDGGPLRHADQDRARTRALVGAANDWAPRRPMWEARIAATHFLSSSPEEAAARCRARHDALVGWDGLLSQGGFDWVKPAVLNPYTRLAVTMSPSRAILRVAGYEMLDSDLPKQVTQLWEL